ncbi:peroxynitrite isomerase THAP4 isoform X1 [Helicoverpa armigera]|uniref:peroxynitrite isomerase THAP4 isoform X1 n=1 Tax=Helicoverpa armigera TaxID=29058 RepID=UPI003082FEAC
MKCAVDGCKNCSGTQSKSVDGITFHVFPVNTEIRKLWLQNLKKPNWSPTIYSKICSIHFDPNDFYHTKSGFKKLRQGSIPKLNLENKPVKRVRKKDTNTPKKFPHRVPKSKQSQPLHVASKHARNGNKKAQKCPKCHAVLPTGTAPESNEQVRSVIARVYHFLEREYEQLKSLHPETDWSPLSRVRQRAAVATGVSEPDVLQILSEESDIAADQHPPTKRHRTDHQSSSDDDDDDNDENDEDDDDDDDDGTINNDEDSEKQAVTYPKESLYIDVALMMEATQMVEFESEMVNIKQEPEYSTDKTYTVPVTVCIPKLEPPDERHSQNNSVNSSAVEACRDDIVRRDKQTTISQPAPHVHTRDPLMIEVKLEEITIEHEGIS